MGNEEFMFACCKQAKAEGEFIRKPEDQDPRVPDLVCFRCPECNRRHFEMAADPGVVGLKGVSL